MIKQLNIKNFQSHEDTSLEFDPGVNIIVGSSDSGKTAILRALKWLAWNRPSGDMFRSHWGGATKVEAIMSHGEDEVIITRSKDKDNQYTLGDSHFTAFGAGVPDEISQALNLNEINLQQQLDRPFLLTESPGEVARYFNKVANLDKIDNGIKNVQKEIRQLEQDLRSEKASMERIQEELTKYEHLDKMEMDVEVLEKMERQVPGKRMSIQRLTAIIEKHQTLESDIEHYADVIEMDQSVNSILSLIDKKAELEGKRMNLHRPFEELQMVDTTIKEIEEFIAMERSVDEIISNTSKKRSAEASRYTLYKLLLKVNRVVTRLKRMSTEIQGLEEDFHKEMPDTCPLCDQKIKK